MIWPWRRKTDHDVTQKSNGNGSGNGVNVARAVREEQQAELEELKEQRREVDNLVKSLKNLRKENQLLPLFIETLRSNSQHPKS